MTVREDESKAHMNMPVLRLLQRLLLLERIIIIII